MCDYSLTHVQSRPAAVGDKLKIHNFGIGTRGFTGQADKLTENGQPVAVCLLPGTELAFDKPISIYGKIGGYTNYGIIEPLEQSTARFTQVNKDERHLHHDALELPGCSEHVLLTQLCEGQTATVLQLPAAPKTEVEAAAQRRVEYAG